MKQHTDWTMDRVIQKIFPLLGMVMMVTGLGYFLYTGFWEMVGKPGRLACGFIAGTLTILAGYNFQERLRNFSDTVIGGGVLLLYITLIYGGRFESAAEINGFIPEGFALFVSAVFVSAIAFYSIERRSYQVLSVGVIGAYCTPFWIGEVGGFENYNISYLGFFVYFLAINLVLLYASFKTKMLEIMGVNTLGLFVGTLSLSALMGDGIANYPVLIPFIAFCIVVANVLFSAQSIHVFQQFDQKSHFSSLYFIAPFLWIWGVLFGAFDADEVLMLWGDHISLSSLLMLGVSFLYFFVWQKLEKNPALPQFFNYVIYALGALALAIGVFDLLSFFGPFAGLFFSLLASIFGVLHIISPRNTRELAYLITASLGIFYLLYELLVMQEFSGMIGCFMLGNIIFSLGCAPFLLHFFMIPSEGKDLFDVRKALAYFAVMMILLLLGVDFLEYFDLRKDFLFFTLPAFFVAGGAYIKYRKGLRKQFFQYVSAALILLGMGYFLTFFALWDKLFPAHSDLPFSSYEGAIGFCSLLVSVFLYVLVKKSVSAEQFQISEETQAESYTDSQFSVLACVVIMAFQVVSYEIIAIYNVFIPPVQDISPLIDTAPVQGLRALLISIWWVGLASLLLFLGIKNENAYLHEKRIGMILLAVALGKILLYDIAHLNTNLKVFLFMGTGALILALSYFRSKKGESE